MFVCFPSGKLFGALIAIAVGILSCSHAALKDEIEAANVKFMSAFASGNATNLGPLYTENCRLMPTGVDVMIGRDGKYNNVMRPREWRKNLRQRIVTHTVW